MFFLGKKPNTAPPATAAQLRGRAGEDRALAHLQSQGMRLLQRNYQAPGRGGGEIDLIMQAGDGTVVFVEVRSRAHAGFGGAGGSIGAAKRRKVAGAAQHWLQRHAGQGPCRFDVVLIEGEQLQWLQAAFDAGEVFSPGI